MAAPIGARQCLHHDIDWDRVRTLTAGITVIPTPVSPGGAVVADIIGRLAPEPYNFPPYDIDANDASLPKR